MIYDLIVVGNGIAAQTFLYEFYKDVKKSQNFSIAHVFSEDIAPACSIRSTASVSLSGIEEGISELGNELREAFFLFEDFVKKNHPDGVEKIEQMLWATDEIEKEKMMRRYGKTEAALHSYLISPEVYLNWFQKKNAHKNIQTFPYFLTSFFKNNNGVYECKLLGHETVYAKKILFCTGAYVKLYAHFFNHSLFQEKTQIVAGTYLEKVIDLNSPSFFKTINGINFIYRSSEKKLIVGSVSTKGAFCLSPAQDLLDLLIYSKDIRDITELKLDQFTIRCGLRHKGIKRRPIAMSLDQEKTLLAISGFYKNGFTFSHLMAKKALECFGLY